MNNTNIVKKTKDKNTQISAILLESKFDFKSQDAQIMIGIQRGKRLLNLFRKFAPIHLYFFQGIRPVRTGPLLRCISFQRPSASAFIVLHKHAAEEKH